MQKQGIPDVTEFQDYKPVEEEEEQKDSAFEIDIDQG